MEFYSATKKNEILSFTGKWMELENIILSEVSQAQKAKNCMFSLICYHRPKTNAAYGTWVTLRRGHSMGKRGQGKKTTNLNVVDMYRNEYRNLKLAGATMGRGLGRSEEDWKG
jgi:hypothetical protein